MDATRFNYSFCVWPDESLRFHPAVFQVFGILKSRVELPFSQSEFDRFRSGLAQHGFTLREVERVPFAEPEPVD